MADGDVVDPTHSDEVSAASDTGDSDWREDDDGAESDSIHVVYD